MSLHDSGKGIVYAGQLAISTINLIRYPICSQDRFFKGEEGLKVPFDEIHLFRSRCRSSCHECTLKIMNEEIKC